jgi:hypothetical protein
MMADDKPMLNDILAKAREIEHLRDMIREANNLREKLTVDLDKYREDLAAAKAALDDIISMKSSKAIKMNSPLLSNPSDYREPDGFMDALTKKRVPYSNAKKGDVVWVGRRKILGVLQDSKGRVKSNGKVYKCDPKDLWYPYPGEPLPVGDK